HIAKVVARFRVVRPEPQRLFEALDGVFRPAEVRQGDAEVVMRCGMGGLRCYRLAEQHGRLGCAALLGKRDALLVECIRGRKCYVVPSRPCPHSPPLPFWQSVTHPPRYAESGRVTD